jgi:hypothetical protein
MNYCTVYIDRVLTWNVRGATLLFSRRVWWEGAIVVYILATAFLFIKEWRCWAILSSPFCHRYSSCTQFIYSVQYLWVGFIHSTYTMWLKVLIIIVKTILKKSWEKQTNCLDVKYDFDTLLFSLNYAYVAMSKNSASKPSNN